MRLFGEDLAHPALRVLLVAITPGDQVDMGMEYRLARTLATIHADVEPTTRRIHLLDALPRLL